MQICEHLDDLFRSYTVSKTLSSALNNRIVPNVSYVQSFKNTITPLFDYITRPQNAFPILKPSFGAPAHFECAYGL